MEYPFLRPDPPKLSQLGEALEKIERSGIFSNFGPTNQDLEDSFIESLFDGVGHCVTTSNATLGLILAIRHAVERRFIGAAGHGKRKYALMPSFTFAATGHAALWNSLVPLLCDIDADTWLPSLSSLEELLDQFTDEVAVIVPLTTFGNNLDLSAYADLSARYDVPIVVDAAASLGSMDWDGRQFGTGCAFPTVYSMHVTKTFSAGEAGLIYCDDAETIERLRCMANFGFGQPRSATMLGLNAKLTEVAALLCHEKLKHIDSVVERRCRLADAYRAELPTLTFQAMRGPRHAYQFISALLPKDDPRATADIVAELAAMGVSTRTYFSPHLAAQSFFRQNSTFFDLSVTEAVTSKIISLPLYDDMTSQDVSAICERLRVILARGQLSPRLRQRR